MSSSTVADALSVADGPKSPTGLWAGEVLPAARPVPSDPSLHLTLPLLTPPPPAGITTKTSEEELAGIFSPYGTVKRADYLPLRQGHTTRSAVVEFTTAEEADSAIQKVNGTSHDGVALTVRLDNR